MQLKIMDLLIHKDAIPKNLAKKMGIKEIFTLAGFGSGRNVRKPRVFGTGTEKMIEAFKDKGVLFGVFGPQAVVGVAGLTIAFAKKYGIEALCLMGETPGGYIG
jgi:proteasome assembly chaperone (PAC2) family protein